MWRGLGRSVTNNPSFGMPTTKILRPVSWLCGSYKTDLIIYGGWVIHEGNHGLRELYGLQLNTQTNNICITTGREILWKIDEEVMIQKHVRTPGLKSLLRKDLGGWVAWDDMLVKI